MTEGSHTGVNQIGGSLLYITELLHRVSNEYTGAISLASRLAGRSCNVEAKNLLDEVVNHLHALAAAHHVLRPPLANGFVDLSANIARLCRAMAAAGLEKRGIRFHLALTECIMLDANRCWHASLIVAELISNASRHASLAPGGRVCVSIDSGFGRIICRVSDDGASCATFNPGLGSVIVDSLAEEIDGCIERRFGKCGTTITLSFPSETDAIAAGADFRSAASLCRELR